MSERKQDTRHSADSLVQCVGVKTACQQRLDGGATAQELKELHSLLVSILGRKLFER